MNQHFMVDIETLGNTADAPITQIAIIHFDPVSGETYEEFDLLVKPNFSLTIPSESTLAWWLKQEDAARLKVAQAIECGLSETRALSDLFCFIHDRCPDAREVRLWGNGATFDNVILDAAYNRRGIKSPWRYSSHRCYRTLVNLVPKKPEIEQVGVHHDGLDDARYQIKVMQAVCQQLGLKEFA